MKNNRIGRYELAPIFYAGLVWMCIGLFGKEHTTFFILGVVFMGLGLKRVADPIPDQKATDTPEPGSH